MRRRTLMALVAGLLAAGAQSGAQAQQRFQMERTDGGFVRLDTETGAVTFCREENGSLTCRMAPDERAAYDKELDLLDKRIAALEAKVGTGASRSLPSEEEVEQSLSIMERFMRRFMDIINEFAGQDRTERAQPDRT